MSTAVVPAVFVWLTLEWLAFLGPGLGWLACRHLSTLAVFLFSCWLRVDNYFIWSFIGPVSFVIVVSGTPSTGALFIQADLDCKPRAPCQLCKVPV